MNKEDKVYIAGSYGMVGSSIWRLLKKKGFKNLIGKSSKELDLCDSESVKAFFNEESPDYVFLAAAKVGGIKANNENRAEFIYENLQIQNNIIHYSYINNVKKLLFFGSSCIYPRDCLQPIKEDYLLDGKLEESNEPYALAKIAGIKMCESYQRQYGVNFFSVMPTNLYGPNDNYNLENSHVLPAIIRKIHLGKALENNDWKTIRKDLLINPVDSLDQYSSCKNILAFMRKIGFSFNLCKHSGQVLSKSVKISLWGTGKPLREFLHVDDLASASIFLMEKLKVAEIEKSNNSYFNIGSKEEISIKELSKIIKKIMDFNGEISFDISTLDGTPRKLLNSKLINDMGWSSNISLKAGLVSVINEFKENFN
jgi:GDP-L-fucose synthase